MKKIMALLLVSVFLISGCSLFKNIGKKPQITVMDSDTAAFTVVNNMQLLETSYFFPYQIDSVINVEHIKPLNKWHENVFRNAETGEPIYQYLYIKTEKDNTVINYKLYKLPTYDSLYVYKKIMYR